MPLQNCLVVHAFVRPTHTIPRGSHDGTECCQHVCHRYTDDPNVTENTRSVSGCFTHDSSLRNFFEKFEWASKFETTKCRTTDMSKFQLRILKYFYLWISFFHFLEWNCKIVEIFYFFIWKMIKFPKSNNLENLENFMIWKNYKILCVRVRVFRNSKITNIKITKDELFDSFIFEFIFSLFINCLHIWIIF